MDPADQAVIAALAEHVRQAIAVGFQQHFQTLGHDLTVGRDQVQGLTQQLHLLQARMDAMERNARHIHEEEEEDDEILREASAATQQAEQLLAKMSSPPADTAAPRTSPNALNPKGYLDVKYVNTLVSSNVPVFKAAGSVQEAKHWLNTACSSRETLSIAKQPPEADELFASTLASRLQGECHQWFRCTYLSSTDDKTRSTDHFLSAFEQRYIPSRSVQQAIRTQFMDMPVQCTKNRWALPVVYDKLTQLLELMPENTHTSVPDQITILMRCVFDDDVRRDANLDVHACLEDAFQAIQKAVADRQHSRRLNTKPTPSVLTTNVNILPV